MLAANPSLPLLEPSEELRPKTSVEVASRAIAAGYVAAASFGAPIPEIRADLERYSLWSFLGQDERAFLTEARPSEHSRAMNGWLIESIQFLAWTLGYVSLDHFAPCEDSLASHFLKPGVDPAHFIAEARLRDLSEIIREADTLYMLHWRAVENQVRGLGDGRVELPMVRFRRHAADWVIGVADNWEDVPLDT